MQRDLSAIQREFVNAILDPQAIDAALATFSGAPELNRERFQLYRGNVFGIWEQTCAAAYPVLRQLLGADFFADLSRMYGLAFPSQSGDLHEFGAQIAEFIATLEQCNAYPYLPDVARLEWQVHRSYYAKYETTATVAHLAAIRPEQFGAIAFTLQPCCAVLQSACLADEIWHAHQSATPVMPQEFDRSSQYLVWRQAGKWAVQVNRLTPGNFAALNAIKEGRLLGEVMECALAVDAQFDLQAALADWFQKQLIISISTETTES